jgi:sortase A
VRTESAPATSSPTPPTPTPQSPSTVAPASRAPQPAPSDGRQRLAVLSIPAIGVDGLRVVPYRGTTDDGPGSTIQDGGVAASPGGPGGGAGPGGVGNYLVTAHRTSSTRAFARTPELGPGDRVRVDVGGLRYVYEIVRTRWTSFRSPASLAAQRAAVPGRPGARPSRAMITLSTCATQEDHAAGNYWSDEHHNPEHRIDKIGVLVATTSR